MFQKAITTVTKTRTMTTTNTNKTTHVNKVKQNINEVKRTPERRAELNRKTK